MVVKVSERKTSCFQTWMRFSYGCAISILILLEFPPPIQGYESYPEQNYQSNNYQPQYEAPPPLYEQYLAITYQELNSSTHCGVIPDTNFELYRKGEDSYELADVAPFGKFPWIVLIIANDKVVCQGTLIHYNLILTSSKCISEYKSLENYQIRVGDWDIVTDYNEYEAYADRDVRICSRHPVISYSPQKSYNSGYGYGYSSKNRYTEKPSDLIVVKAVFETTDKLPHIKPVCLPKTYVPSTYYGKEQDPYAPYAACWVAGWYGSEITKLQNHPLPEGAPGYENEGTSGYSYGLHGSGKDHYHQRYYKGYDFSMVQKRAKVKQVPCPYSSYSSGSSEICFIGVEGYDACVAEQGSAVFCVIQENDNYGSYSSGYTTQYSQSDPTYATSRPTYEPVDASYHIPVYSALHPDYYRANYRNPIKAAPSDSKSARYRAVLYAVVQKPAKCRIGLDSYGYEYSRKSQPLVATRLDYESVNGIMDQFWSHGYDKSCPVSETYYKSPKIRHKHYQNKASYKQPYYFGSYQDAPNKYSTKYGTPNY